MKISTDSIQGFAEMTPEEKLAAVLGLDVPDPVDLSQYVEKKTFDAKASEAADLSKKLKAHMSDEEAAKAQEAAEKKALQEKYDALLRESTISKHTAKFLALGYDKELAAKTAEALFDGDMDKVFENQSKFITDREAVLKAEHMKQMPETKHMEPAGGNEPYVPPTLI